VFVSRWVQQNNNILAVKPIDFTPKQNLGKVMATNIARNS
jgi:hypothetical protein